MSEEVLDLTLIIACYNEAEHLEGSVARLLGICDLLRVRYEVIFIDDCSTDRTQEILGGLHRKYPSHCLSVHLNEKNLGRGATVTRGLELARAPIAGFLDIDLEIDAAYITSFYLALLAGADIVMGRRIYKVSLRSVPRFVLTWGYILLRRSTLSLPFQDTEAGFKFFRIDSIRPVLRECEDPHWFWDTEIVARAYDAGLQIVEVDCLFMRRRDKTSTVRPIRDSWRHLARLLAFYRSRRSTRQACLEGTVAQGPAKGNVVVDRIERYWKEKPELFVRQHIHNGGLLSLGVSRFLLGRLERITSLLKTEMDDVALDVGCGSGVYTIVLRQLGARVVGVDFSRAMLERARQNVPRERGVGPWFVLADAFALPVASGVADYVLSVGLLDYVLDTRGALKEFRRAMRPGGELVFTIPKSPSPFGFLRFGPGLWVRRRFFGLPPIRVAIRRSLLFGLLRDLGLELIGLETVSHTMWIVQCRKPTLS